jgi:hypothetical protein
MYLCVGIQRGGQMKKRSAKSIADKILKKHGLKQTVSCITTDKTYSLEDIINMGKEALIFSRKDWSTEDRRFFASIGIDEAYLTEERITSIGKTVWR